MISLMVFLPVSSLFFTASILTRCIYSATVLRVAFLNHQFYTGIMIFEFISISPVRGALFPIKYARKSHQKRSGTQCSHGRSRLIPVRQPYHTVLIDIGGAAGMTGKRGNND